jgi:hypothetical protein
MLLRPVLKSSRHGLGDQPVPGVLQSSREYLEHPLGELVPEVRIGGAAVPDGLRPELDRYLHHAITPWCPLSMRWRKRGH